MYVAMKEYVYTVYGLYNLIVFNHLLNVSAEFLAFNYAILLKINRNLNLNKKKKRSLRINNAVAQAWVPFFTFN